MVPTFARSAKVGHSPCLGETHVSQNRRDMGHPRVDFTVDRGDLGHPPSRPAGIYGQVGHVPQNSRQLPSDHFQRFSRRVSLGRGLDRQTRVRKSSADGLCTWCSSSSSALFSPSAVAGRQQPRPLIIDDPTNIKWWRCIGFYDRKF